MIKNPTQIDSSRFGENFYEQDVKYGLPPDVVYCKRCVVSNQRPNSVVEYRSSSKNKKSAINIDAEGICDACRYADAKKQGIDWSDRERQLWELCDRHRSRSGSFDCIVPGSGGKDSFYASHILKTKYRMNPLTVTWAPHLYTDWGWKNFQSWIHAGHDNVLITPNGKVHRLLTRLAFDKLLHPFQPFILGQKSIASKVAAQYGISLIFYGENEAEYGNPIGQNEEARRDDSFIRTSEDYRGLYVSGVEVRELLSVFNLKQCDLHFYLPATNGDLASTETHYLGYYLKWHPQSCYYYAVEHGGFEASPERTTGTYSKYNSIDDKMDDYHYYTTGVKFGIGRATYDASQEIRSGDIDRSEGVALVKRFDHEYPVRFWSEISRYLSIDSTNFPDQHQLFESPEFSNDYFDSLCDSYRSPHIWKQIGGKWELRCPL